MNTPQLFPIAEACQHGRARAVCPFCHTRATDPDTSLAAARQALAGDTPNTIRATILALLAGGPLTDDGIVKWFAEHGQPGSPSGIRTRRKELVDDGLVFRHRFDGLSPTGGKAARWYAHDRHTR